MQRGLQNFRKMSKGNKHLVCQKYLSCPSSVLLFIAVNLKPLHCFGKFAVYKDITIYSCLLLISSRPTVLWLIPWSRFLHQKLTDLELVKKFRHVRKPGELLPHPQAVPNCPHLEPDQSNSCSKLLLLEISF